MFRNSSSQAGVRAPPVVMRNPFAKDPAQVPRVTPRHSRCARDLPTGGIWHIPATSRPPLTEWHSTTILDDCSSFPKIYMQFGRISFGALSLDSTYPLIRLNTTEGCADN